MIKRKKKLGVFRKNPKRRLTQLLPLLLYCDKIRTAVTTASAAAITANYSVSVATKTGIIIFFFVIICD